jgi:hypothetical protein
MKKVTTAAASIVLEQSDQTLYVSISGKPTA